MLHDAKAEQKFFTHATFQSTYLLSFYVNGTKVRPWKRVRLFLKKIVVLMDIEKEENRKKMAKFAYSKVLSYTSVVTEISNFYKYLPSV